MLRYASKISNLKIVDILLTTSKCAPSISLGKKGTVNSLKPSQDLNLKINSLKPT